jgi:hypothetical protein
MVATAITRLRPPADHHPNRVGRRPQPHDPLDPLFILLGCVGVAQVLSHVHGSSGAPLFSGLYPFCDVFGTNRIYLLVEPIF